MVTFVRPLPVINGLKVMNKFNFNLKVVDKGLEDYEELFEFFSSHQYTHFSNTKFTGYMKCLFNDNPFGKGLQVFARDPYGKLIGYNSIISVHLIYNGKVISGGQNINLLVHSDFRKKNLFLEMANRLFESAASHNINLIYGFPNEAAVPGHIRTGGWNFKDLSYFKTKISETSEYNTINKYISIKNFGNLTGKELSENKTDYNLLQIHKTIEYLNWRFITLRTFFDYNIFKILDSSDNLLGIVVFNKYKKEEIIYGQIIDTTIPIKNQKIFSDLLNFYFDYFKNKKIFNLQFLLLSERSVKKFLKSRGFQEDSKNRFFLYRTKNQRYTYAINSDRYLFYLSSKDNL